MGTKISELTAVTALDGSEYVEVAQSGTSKKATTAELGANLVASINGATGAIDFARGISACSRAGAGDYTVTLSAAHPLGEAFPLVTPQTNTARMVTAEVSSTTQIRVRTFNDAGVATDSSFVILIVFRV